MALFDFFASTNKHYTHFQNNCSWSYYLNSTECILDWSWMRECVGRRLSAGNCNQIWGNLLFQVVFSFFRGNNYDHSLKIISKEAYDIVHLTQMMKGNSPLWYQFIHPWCTHFHVKLFMVYLQPFIWRCTDDLFIFSILVSWSKRIFSNHNEQNIIQFNNLCHENLSSPLLQSVGCECTKAEDNGQEIVIVVGWGGGVAAS